MRTRTGAAPWASLDHLAEGLARDERRLYVTFQDTVGQLVGITSETRTLGPIEDPLSGPMHLFHNVIHIRYIEHCAAIGRVLNVLMRNSRHDNGIYACHITDDGITVGNELTYVTATLGWNALRDCPATLPPVSHLRPRLYALGLGHHRVSARIH